MCRRREHGGARDLNRHNSNNKNDYDDDDDGNNDHDTIWRVILRANIPYPNSLLSTDGKRPDGAVFDNLCHRI